MTLPEITANKNLPAAKAHQKRAWGTLQAKSLIKRLFKVCHLSLPICVLRKIIGLRCGCMIYTLA
jgi:hypothetical protein